MPSATAEFGYTTWGRDFLRIAEPTHITKPEPLLPRARSLARNAMTDVRVEGRLIRGTVVRGGEASVAYLEFVPMDRDLARAVADRIGHSPASSTLTDDAHAMIAAHLPELAVVDCSCRARVARCVHVLALVYETVRRVDENPSLALSLRGFRDAIEGTVTEDSTVAKWTPLSALDPHRFYEV